MSNETTWLLHDIILIGMIVSITLYAGIQVALILWDMLLKSFRK